MFSRPSPPADPIRFRFEGREVVASRGDSVAAALLASGVSAFRRSMVTGEPRAAYCMIGHCYECLLEIDGVASTQACMTEVREGMEVRTGRGPREIGAGDA